MKRILFSLMAVLVSVGPVFAEKPGTLPGLLNPEMIVVSDDEAFIVQAAEIFTYSLNDLTLTRKVGKKRGRT